VAWQRVYYERGQPVEDGRAQCVRVVPQPVLHRPATL